MTLKTLLENKIYVLGVFLMLLICIVLDLQLGIFIASLPQSTTLPISLNSSESPCYVNPYCEINVKSLMMDPPNVYIHHPLAKFFNYQLDFASTYNFISANVISLSHVPVALVAGRFVSHDSLCHRRVGVLLFEVRNFLDALDGAVAVARRSEKSYGTHNSKVLVTLTKERTTNAITTILDKITPNRNQDEELEKRNKASANLGYIFDGVCDGLGCLFLFIGCFLYLQKHPIRNNQFSYKPLPLVTVSKISSKSSVLPSSSTDIEKRTRTKYRIPGRNTVFRFRSKTFVTRQIIRSVQRSGLKAMSFGFQSLLGSIAWNRYIANYSRILEDHNHYPNPQNPSESQSKAYKSKLLHSPLIWCIFFVWRYINPHAMVEVLLVAIFLNRMGEFLSFLQVIGFIPIVFAACFTELYLYAIEL